MGNPVGEMMVQLLKKKEEKAQLPEKSPEEYDIKERPDRVGKYFKKYTKNFVFDEFSEAFIKRTGFDFMKGVPIPLRKQDLEFFKGGDGLKMNHIAENIAWIKELIEIRIYGKLPRVYKRFSIQKQKIVNGLVQGGQR